MGLDKYQFLRNVVCDVLKYHSGSIPHNPIMGNYGQSCDDYSYIPGQGHYIVQLCTAILLPTVGPMSRSQSGSLLLSLPLASSPGRLRSQHWPQ
jgi:hypothetical protein